MLRYFPGCITKTEYSNKFKSLSGEPRMHKKTKKYSAYFADAVFNEFYYNLIQFINNKYNQLKMKPIN